MMSQEACAVCGGRRDSQTTTSRTDDTAAKCVAIGAVVVCALAATMRCRQMRCARTQRRRLKGRRGGKVGRKSIRSGATSDKRTRSRSKNRPPLSVSIISPTPKCPTKSTRGNGGLKALSSAVVMRTRTVSGFALGSPSSAPTVLTAISVFNELATANAGGELKKMSEEAFAKALRDKLHLKLSPVEASRLFCNCDRCSNGSITLRPFLLAVRDNVFMRRVISSLRFPPKDTVPPGYDFSVPTYIAHRHEKYKGGSSWGTSTVSKYSPDVHGSLVGEFAHIRKTLDYSWHTNYSEKRQLWQDSLVNRVARRHRPVSDPWLVLTCGPMGAGKGYALRWMSKVGVFPLENVVQIDPDHFKAAMPEWDGYVRADPHCAGTLTHKESGFIQELAQTVSLKGHQNTWIDGSLQDHEWWSEWIQNVRTEYPSYRIAIFFVYARDQQIIDRANARGEETGRFVPLHIIQESIVKTSEAIEVLGPLADFVARIDNSAETPALDLFEDRTHLFEVISHHFGTVEQKLLPSSPVLATRHTQ